MGKVEASFPKTSCASAAAVNTGSVASTFARSQTTKSPTRATTGSSWVEHQKFRDAVLGVAPAEVSLFDGLLSVAIGAAAHRSIDEGRPVDLSEFLR